jgi:sterol desaturase/sphingolipid hydroxylase (fatty acid hydroxylase superfamily)
VAFNNTSNITTAATGGRFHPLEILLSMLIKFAVIILLGPPVVTSKSRSA